MAERAFDGLSAGLNAAVLHMASRCFPTGFDVSPTAPDKFDALKKHVETTGRMEVWNGASDLTIFGTGNSEVNFAFRAWHDWCHLAEDAPFTKAGEHKAAVRQCRDLVAVYGNSPTVMYWCAIIMAEVDGQGDFYRRHKGFPLNQREFVRDYLENPDAALANPQKYGVDVATVDAA